MDSELDVGQVGKVLMVAGAELFVVGALVVLLSKTGLFRLPGDIHVGGEKWRFSFPVTTYILISIVLTAIFWMIRWFLRK